MAPWGFFCGTKGALFANAFSLLVLLLHFCFSAAMEAKRVCVEPFVVRVMFDGPPIRRARAESPSLFSDEEETQPVSRLSGCASAVYCIYMPQIYSRPPASLRCHLSLQASKAKSLAELTAELEFNSNSSFCQILTAALPQIVLPAWGRECPAFLSEICSVDISNNQVAIVPVVVVTVS